jgi:tRNA 2-thiouridine synthesizing protein A
LAWLILTREYISRFHWRKRFLAVVSKMRQETVREAQYSLDISAETCPLTFVRTKLLLEDMAAGEVACIRLGEGEPLDNLPRTLRDQGHDVLELRPETPGGAVYRMLVRKGPRPG